MGPVELLIVAFNDEQEAGNALKQLKKKQKEGMVVVLNAAVIKKDEKGRLSVRETEDVGTRQGAIFGAVIGGVIGLLGGPGGVIVGAAAGATTGGVAASKIDMGFSDEDLKEIEKKLDPGSSAIVALLEHEWVEKVVEELEKVGAMLYRQALKDEVTERLQRKLDGFADESGE